MAKKIQRIEVLGKFITIDPDDFISLTDMLKAKVGDFFISDWVRNRNTLEYLAIWERIHNPDFNYGEFATITQKAGLNNYKISVKEWVAKTNDIGIRAKAGRYGGMKLENLNAIFIGEELSQRERLEKLNHIAIEQMKNIVANEFSQVNRKRRKR